MKEKVVIAVLALICIASVIGNVYQYNMLNSSRQQLADARMQLESMTNSYTDLDAQLVAMQEELDALNINMADKQSEIDSLTKENSDLVSSISELEKSIEESKGVSKEEAVAEQTATDTAQAEQTTSTQTDMASTTTNQSTATGIDDDILKKMEANGFSFSNGDTNIVEAGNESFTHASGAVWE